MDKLTARGVVLAWGIHHFVVCEDLDWLVKELEYMNMVHKMLDGLRTSEHTEEEKMKRFYHFLWYIKYEMLRYAFTRVLPEEVPSLCAMLRGHDMLKEHCVY
jgi:hypothetical protein